MKILHKHTREVLLEDESSDIKTVLGEAAEMGADLGDANLGGVNGNMVEIKTIRMETYPFAAIELSFGKTYLSSEKEASK